MARRIGENNYEVAPGIVAQVIKQGKTIIERDGESFVVMHPDGAIEGAGTKAGAERIAKRWYQKDIAGGMKVGIGEIEWRN